MDRTPALEVLEREAARVLALCGPGADLERPVPSCPGWTLGRVAEHLGAVYAFVAAILEGPPDEPPDRERIPRRPEGQAGADWMEERLAVLLPLLREAPDDGVAWNFVSGPSSSVAFWWRRQAHETLVHRADAELAAGVAVEPVEPEVAADGVAELLENFGYRPVAWDEIRLGEGLTVHLHATDAGPHAEWTVDAANRTVAAAHLKADVAVRGTAWALDRWCWRRDTPAGEGELEIFGDRPAAEEWRPTL